MGHPDAVGKYCIARASITTLARYPDRRAARKVVLVNRTREASVWDISRPQRLSWMHVRPAKAGVTVDHGASAMQVRPAKGVHRQMPRGSRAMRIPLNSTAT